MKYLILPLSISFFCTESRAFVFQAHSNELCAHHDASWTPQYDKIQAYWKLDGGLGSQPVPDTSNSQAKPDGYQGGTYRNANGTGLTFTSGVVGTALSFDGVDDYITVGYTEKLAPTNAITVSTYALFKAKESMLRQPIFSKTSFGGYVLDLFEASLRFSVYVNDSYRTVSIGTEGLNNEQWYHIAATYDGNTVKLYVDGALVATTSYTGSISYSVNNTACIGREAGSATCNVNELFNGSLDELAVWDVALTAAEIATIYNRRNCNN